MVPEELWLKHTESKTTQSMNKHKSTGSGKIGRSTMGSRNKTVTCIGCGDTFTRQGAYIGSYCRPCRGEDEDTKTNVYTPD